MSIAGQTVTSSVVPLANERLGQALAEKLALPVRIQLYSPIIAEYRKLPEPAPRSMCVLRAGDGVSAHAIEAGQRLVGRHSLAGELGHVTIEEGGPLCGCGRRGCLETRCSGPAIYKRAMEDLRHGVTSELLPAEMQRLSIQSAIERIWQAWQNGDTFGQVKDYGLIGTGIGGMCQPGRSGSTAAAGCASRSGHEHRGCRHRAGRRAGTAD